MNSTLLHRPLLCQCQLPVNSCTGHEKLMVQCSSFGSKRASFDCRCIKNEKTSDSQQGFSALLSDSQGDIGSIWASMGFYVFSVHVPLSFGGLSAAAKILHQPVLNPQTEALLILAIQTLELSIVLLLLKFPGKPQYDFPDFFRANRSSKQRSWLLASMLGFGVLLSLVFATSYFAESLLGHKDVNNPFLKEILSSGSSSVAACTLAYCAITPLLEEVVYRGFLLTSLASKMSWQQAVTVSSIVFSAAHFSALLILDEGELVVFAKGGIISSYDKLKKRGMLDLWKHDYALLVIPDESFTAKLVAILFLVMFFFFFPTMFMNSIDFVTANHIMV